jgi:protein TonB
MVNNQLKAPTAIPKKISKVVDTEEPISSSGGVVGGIGFGGSGTGGVLGGVLGSIASAAPTAVPKQATPQRIRVSSGVTEGMRTHEVKPLYPPLAKQARVQGTVVLSAIISKEGNIEQLKVMSGHPMLIQNALDAVRQWKYKPYVLNGEPVEVDTTISVVFTLGG